MLLCTRCKKRPAVVFVSNGMDSQNPQGLCLVCAKELGIKPVNDIMEKMGITDEELEAAFRPNTKAVFGETIANPALTVLDIEKFAKAAHAHSFIRRLPEGYDTVIAEDGGNISQGQKQLLCIARVMLCLPPMLILDEATSSIDTRTEVRIQAAFARMMQGRTSFIVAHRLSTIREADVILVMKDGHIVEQGDHDTLLAQGGFYAKLYNSQFEGVET